ncbi:hypothetical protein BRARA_E02010 [Brassica rapa]|uniref:Bifunctional inhibitor/plant lipid transfer protein/seed storage helical domain-containing protein n=1 Tax=Brassica campestris TaxID=3711 RepID=A0A397ZBS9_BRACM|nr:hypothetical protein BRARA_E02010 [Brassica rapa]
MGSHTQNLSFLILLLLGFLAVSFACECSPPKPSPRPHKPPKHPVKPPKPPAAKPPKPPAVKPPKPPTKPPTLKPHPHPKPPTPETCPIDTLKLGACVDVLGGLIHIGLGGSSAKKECCPVLGGLVDLDAAVCLCTTIKAKLLIVDLIIPIALELLIDCGKTPPPGFKCPS